MRLALSLGLLLAGATARNGCGDGGPVAPPYDPCAAKACGDSCTVCPPGDPRCFETAVLKACDPRGACVPAGTFSCATMPDPCAGRACGDACVISLPCRYSSPPCMVPDLAGHCDVSGLCVAGDFGSCAPHPDCVGKACGASCNPCLPGAVCPTFVASACDPWGRCVGAVPGLCACAGKACGASCDPCDGLCLHPYASDCDATGRCVPVGSGYACTP